MNGARTRGQATALDSVARMVRDQAPSQAILFVGPDGIGKTTLALDLAAGLLCEADPAMRPCRACRACEMVDRGRHPDLHRLGPVGPGRQVVIGGPDAKYRGVRDLIEELALMSVEGRSRVAIIEAAERMNEDAQSALLKTLEEPAPGVVIILCADPELRLLPTVRSRCTRIRLGLVGSRDIEAVVADHDLADPPLAARLGRLAAGRPGRALAFARAPEAVLIRAELSRVLLDLVGAGVATRLAAVRTAMPRALAMNAALATWSADDGPVGPRPRRRRAKGNAVAEPAGGAPPGDDETTDDADAPRQKVSPTERRQAAEILSTLWAEVARDLALVRAGGARSVRDPVLLEELQVAAAALDPGALAAFLDRAERAMDLIASNVSPELVLDWLVLAWPRRSAAA